jgi:hypothetical protein
LWNLVLAVECYWKYFAAKKFSSRYAFACGITSNADVDKVKNTLLGNHL